MVLHAGSEREHTLYPLQCCCHFVMQGAAPASSFKTNLRLKIPESSSIYFYWRPSSWETSVVSLDWHVQKQEQKQPKQWKFSPNKSIWPGEFSTNKARAKASWAILALKMARTSFQLISAMCSEGWQRFRGSFCCSASEQRVRCSLACTKGCSFEGETSLKLEEAPAIVVPLFWFVCFICGQQGCKGSQARVSFGIFPVLPMEAPSVQSSSITHSEDQGPRREQKQSIKKSSIIECFC